MEFQNNKAREYYTDVLNTHTDNTNDNHALYDPHPYLKDRINSDNRTRTSFQDSNVFGYKINNNVTWQDPGRDVKSAGIRSGDYIHAFKSTDNIVYDPNAPMAGQTTQSHQSYVQPTPDMYLHNDPQVPKSRLGEEIFGMKDFNRQAAAQDLQSRDEHWLKQSEVQANKPSNSLSHQDRKQLELHSSLSNHEPIPYHPAPQEFHNTVLDTWKDPKKSVKPSNVITEINTFEKRAEQLSSMNNPLSTTDYSQFIPKTKEVSITEDVETRVKDAFYSDLYGQTGKYGPKTSNGLRSEISSQTGIFSKEGQSKGNRWGEEISAAQRRQDFMRETGFPTTGAEQQVASTQLPDQTHINLARNQLRMPKVIKGSELESTSLHSDEFYKKYNVIKDHKEINVVSLIFKNLPKEMDADTLKVMSGAHHVVRCAVKIDNIKNECTGEGEITIRLFENETKQDFMNRFRTAGLNVEEKPEDAGKRQNTYHLLANTGF